MSHQKQKLVLKKTCQRKNRDRFIFVDPVTGQQVGSGDGSETTVRKMLLKKFPHLSENQVTNLFKNARMCYDTEHNLDVPNLEMTAENDDCDFESDFFTDDMPDDDDMIG